MIKGNILVKNVAAAQSAAAKKAELKLSIFYLFQARAYGAQN
jgi:hypothetical protein